MKSTKSINLEFLTKTMNIMNWIEANRFNFVLTESFNILFLANLNKYWTLFVVNFKFK